MNSSSVVCALNKTDKNMLGKGGEKQFEAAKCLRMAFGAAADSTAARREGSEDHGSPTSNVNKDEHETGSRGEGTMHSEQSQNR